MVKKKGESNNAHQWAEKNINKKWKPWAWTATIAALALYLTFAIPHWNELEKEAKKQELAIALEDQNAIAAFPSEINKFINKIWKKELEKWITFNGAEIKLVNDYRIDYEQEVEALQIATHDWQIFDLIKDDEGKRFTKYFHLKWVENELLPNSADYKMIIGMLNNKEYPKLETETVEQR